jgi:hypothetical protein
VCALHCIAETKATLASSFDSEDLPDDAPTQGRQETVVLAAPSTEWDAGVPTNRKNKSRKCLVSSGDNDRDSSGDNSQTFKSDWSNTRTHQNFLVDSIEIERKVKDDSKNDDRKSKSNPSQQLSPYLSLPKQPPTMSLVQEGELLFQEIDRDGDGVVSKIDIIKALRVNSPLAKVRTVHCVALHCVVLCRAEICVFCIKQKIDL